MRLGSPLAEELADFCAVVYAADEIKVVRKGADAPDLRPSALVIDGYAQ